MDNSLFKLVSDWMKIENLGIASSKRKMCTNDKRALDIIENTTKLVNVHYEVRLLWKENADQPDEKTPFLPHHPLTNENKPGNVRRVANASSVFQGQSLNSNLLKGPDLLSNCTGVILRFR